MAIKLKSSRKIWITLLAASGVTNLLMAFSIFRDLLFYHMTFTLFLVGSGLALLAAAVIWNKRVQHVPSEKGTVESVYLLLPVDFRLLLLILSALFSLRYFASNLTPYLPADIVYIYILACGFNLLIGLQIVSIISEVHDRESLLATWKSSLTCRFFHILKEGFTLAPIAFQISGILAAVFTLGFILPILANAEGLLLPLILLPAAGLPLLYLIFRNVAAFNHIYLNIQATAEGRDAPDLTVHGKGTLASLAENLNILKHGVTSSRVQQLKSERLKTELITNVSHDLRTPLTSIMTYNELLQKPDLAEDERTRYLSIIDRKAKRLKRLIDDLFEASKMASGAVELHRDRVNLNELLTQALAEYDEEIKKSPFEFRVRTSDQPVCVTGDGQKIWRVFDNLIRNVLKYSLEHTRVYIQLTEEEGQAVVVFKNITKYELGDNVDELFERFKRGDASRHTEGSGLGLAIAKSIVDLHNGLFEITLDGDLFKVTLKLPQ
ncbi:HAMP domain-containing sensor histidine kinase [Sporolactobacillus sp. Y61]|uniref:histidine kinase n=1 Tax=Sporolactobacillus sp. Y61 TaxID=3160863 RepID=A0AAU8ICT2_9BACL